MALVNVALRNQWRWGLICCEYACAHVDRGVIPCPEMGCHGTHSDEDATCGLVVKRVDEVLAKPEQMQACHGDRKGCVGFGTTLESATSTTVPRGFWDDLQDDGP